MQKKTCGSVGEWLIPTDCKSVALRGFVGSNPTAPTKKRRTNMKCEDAIKELERVPFMFPYDGGLGPAYREVNELPSLAGGPVKERSVAQSG